MIYNTDLLEKFKTQKFNALSLEERKELVRSIVLSIIEGKQLSDVTIEFVDDGFGYDPFTNVLRVANNYLDGSEPNSNYTLLTGIIHEMRHKEQSDKGFDSFDIGHYYQGNTYYFSPPEIDAHTYATKELLQLSSFFDDNEFDKYIYLLMNADDYDRRTRLNGFLLNGYTEDELRALMRQQALYYAEFLPKVDESFQESIMVDGRQIDVDPENINNFKLMCLLSGKKYGAVKEFESGVKSVAQETDIVFIKDENMYIQRMLFNCLFDNKVESFSARDLIEQIQTRIGSIIETVQAQDSTGVKFINFPVMSFINNKEQQERIYQLMGVQDGKIEIDSLMNLDLNDPKFDESFSKDIRDVDLQDLLLLFGIDYQSKYSKEQQLFFERILPYIRAYAKFVGFGVPMNDPENEIKAKDDSYLAISAYKPDFSLEKLKLIFAAQREGLNTMYYEKLNEEQIRELMISQKEGLSRQQLAELVLLSSEDMRKRRSEILGRNAKFKSVTFNDDFDLIFDEIPDNVK